MKRLLGAAAADVAAQALFHLLSRRLWMFVEERFAGHDEARRAEPALQAVVFDEGRLRPIPFVELIDEATGKIKVRMVDTTSENYVVGRNYMIRIEKEDLSGENLDRLARTARMTAGAFLERFVKIC